MEQLREALVAFLAAVGLTTLVWLSVEILARRRERLPRALVLLPLRGAAEDVEAGLRTLRWLGDPAVVLVDCGLNEEGLHRVDLLVREREELALAAPEDLPEYIKKR